LTLNEDPKHSQAIARLETMAVLLDSRFRIPNTDFRFGIESLIGLVPVYGDFLGLLFSAVIVILIAAQGVPGSVLFRICLNVFIDFFIGLVPVLGDIADIFFKANIRNVALARKYFNEPRKVQFQSKAFIAFVVILILLFIVGVFAALVWFTVELVHLFS
jgi:hypothetical protein